MQSTTHSLFQQVETFYNQGHWHRNLGQITEAIACYEQAISLMPNLAEAHYSKGLALITSGDFAQGWPLYEWRWQLKGRKRREFTQPLWLGQENIQGKTLLAYGEQGVGDVFQFCRYLPYLSAQGVHTILGVPQDLISLCSSLNIAAVVDNPPAVFDYHCPLMSLPLACQTFSEQAIPARMPYLFAPADRITHWETRLGIKHKPRVGLVWRGNPSYSLDNDRNAPLAQLLTNLPTEQIAFIQVQKELTDAERAILQSENIDCDTAHNLLDWGDTAGLLMNLDLLITVDTAVAHLAGALGKPVWLLNRFNTCWRWLLGRTDTPWYPSMTLYRQTQLGDWHNILATVKHDLLIWHNRQTI